jgi:hypothetical protein
MSEIPSNSFKSKLVNADQPAEEVRPKLTSIVTTPVTRKKKSMLASFSENFLGSDTKTVGQMIVWDILIPAAKDTLFEIIKGGFEALLYGEPKSGRMTRDKGRTVINYNSISSDRRSDRDRRPERREPIRVAQAQQFDDIVIARRGEAELVLEGLRDILEQYEVVSVQDFYELLGMTPSHVDNKWGWYNLSRADVERVRDGYVINLPKAEVLD